MHIHPVTRLTPLFALLLAACVCGLASDAPAQTARYSLPVRSYFSMTETFSSDVQHFPKWTGMEARYAQQQQWKDEECGMQRFHPCTVREWKTLFDTWRQKIFLDMIVTVNDYANAYPYVLDQINWGMEDYWEAPYEFLAISGDCEDYSIIKYYTLRAAGVPASRLRVMIVQDFNLGGIIHAVLGVYDENNTLYILDNQIKQVVPALSIYHYKPIYGINEEGWWAYYPR